MRTARTAMIRYKSHSVTGRPRLITFQSARMNPASPALNFRQRSHSSQTLSRTRSHRICNTVFPSFTDGFPLNAAPSVSSICVNAHICGALTFVSRYSVDPFSLNISHEPIVTRGIGRAASVARQLKIEFPVTHPSQPGQLVPRRSLSAHMLFLALQRVSPKGPGEEFNSSNCPTDADLHN
jgi:hypothetical protein